MPAVRYMWIVEIAHRVGHAGLATPLMAGARVAVTAAFLLVSVVVDIVDVTTLTVGSLLAMTASMPG